MSTNTEFAVFEALDLSPIKLKLMHVESGEGWSERRVNAVEAEYRRFLFLMKKYPDAGASPTIDVDMFWHYHILDTMKYARDCEATFGFFLHHYPYVGMGAGSDDSERLEAGERMRAIYESEFGVVVKGDAAFCGAPSKQVLQGSGIAFCGAPSKPQAQASDTAFCGAPSKQLAQAGDTAFCGAPSKQLMQGSDTAFCGAPSKQLMQASDTAFCGAPSKQLAQGSDTAFCGAPSKQLAHGGDTAFCGAPSKQLLSSSSETAFCGAPSKRLAHSNDVAFCGAPSKAVIAA